MKRCFKCQKELPLEDFPRNRTRRDGRASSCKPCVNEYKKAHYNNNKQPYIDRVTARTKANKERLIAIKETTPCKDCGYFYEHYQMDYDHLGDDKKDNVARLITFAWGTVLAEIAKCDLVCANCHRERTWQRMMAKRV